MKAKIIIGEWLKKIGIVDFSLKFIKKFGYLSKFSDEHCSGIDLSYDISSNVPIKDIKTAFDIGASIGSMTSKIISTFPFARIYSFEPYSVSFEKLKNSFQTNKNVIVNKKAMSNVSGKFKMYIKKDTGYNSLSELSNIPDVNNNEIFEMVEIITIDKYCEQNNIDQIDFLKIDTEGLELKVLEGAINLLNNRKIRYIFAECTFDKEYVQNTYFEALYQFLKKYDFKLRAIYDQSTFGNTSYISSVNALFFLQVK